MSYRFKKKNGVIFAIVISLVIAVGSGVGLWYLNSRDTQVAPDDSGAAMCCNSFTCADGTSFGHDLAYGGSSCGERHSACDPHGGVVEEGNQCGGGGQTCGGIGQACCQPGNGCESSLHCQAGVCDVSGGACNGTATCDNNGCYCNPAGHNCSPTFAEFHCSITGPNPNQIPVSCGGANENPEARNTDVCKTIQYDVSECNGNNANVVWVDADGTRCSSNDGGLEVCLARPDFDLSACAPKSCTITQGQQCLEDGMVRVSWNATASGFNIAPNEGRVVVRLDNKKDGWSPATIGPGLSDTWWSTHNAEYVSSGRNPSNGSWDFPAVGGDTYGVRVSVDPTIAGATTDGLCSGVEQTFSCEGNNPPTCSGLTASSSTVRNGNTITLTSVASDPDNNLSKVEFYWAATKSDNNYCTQSLWKKIGDGTRSGNNWVYTWNVSGIPATGSIVVAANVFDTDGALCTGNPSGACSSGGTSCSNCSLTLSIDKPVCESLRVTGGPVQNGNSATITIAASDANSSVTSIPIYWAPVQTSNNYCAPATTWTLIGNAVKGSGNSWTHTWNITGIPNEGEIMISADLTGSGNTIFCTGNPSGACNSGAQAGCPTCNQKVRIAVPMCGGACNSDDQCSDGLQCSGGMCRNPMCVEKEDCECDVPVTNIFDNTRNKIIAGFVLISLSLAYMLFDGFDRLALNVYNRASEVDLKDMVAERLKERRVKKIQNNRVDFEKRIGKK